MRKSSLMHRQPIAQHPHRLVVMNSGVPILLPGSSARLTFPECRFGDRPACIVAAWCGEREVRWSVMTRSSISSTGAQRRMFDMLSSPIAGRRSCAPARRLWIPSSAASEKSAILMRGSPATETTCLFAPRSDATDAVRSKHARSGGQTRLSLRNGCAKRRRSLPVRTIAPIALPYIAARQVR